MLMRATQPAGSGLSKMRDAQQPANDDNHITISDNPIVFVQPPASFGNKTPCLDDKQFGLGILANAAWLEGHGIPTRGVHIPLSLHYGLSIDDVLALIVGHDPLLVAIGLNWVHFSGGAIETAQALKARRPKLPIVLGGQHAGLFAQEIAQQNANCIDGVILGEAELSLLAICRSLQETGGFPAKLPGLARAEGEVLPPEVVQPIDDLPIYRYSSLRPKPLKTDVAAISTTRGACPFNCSWCIEPVIGRLQGRRKLQFHSARRIVDQIEALTREDIAKFTIQDNFFVGGDTKLVDLANELQRRELKPVHINIFAHPDGFSAEGLLALARRDPAMGKPAHPPTQNANPSEFGTVRYHAALSHLRRLPQIFAYHACGSNPLFRHGDPRDARRNERRRHASIKSTPSVCDRSSLGTRRLLPRSSLKA
jgi:hypothetical protein